MLLEHAQAVRRHQGAGALVVVAPPRQVRPVELAAVAGRVEHPDPLLDHLGPDAVAANHRDPMPPPAGLVTHAAMLPAPPVPGTRAFAVTSA